MKPRRRRGRKRRREEAAGQCQLRKCQYSELLAGPASRGPERRSQQRSKRRRRRSSSSRQDFKSAACCLMFVINLGAIIISNQLELVAAIGPRAATPVQQLELADGPATLGPHSGATHGLQANSSAAHLERARAESRVAANLGQNVVLNCAVHFPDGQERPFVVNWLKHPNKLPIYIWYAGYPPHIAPGYERRVSRIGQASLNLSSIRQDDQGLYECKIYYLDHRRQPAGQDSDKSAGAAGSASAAAGAPPTPGTNNDTYIYYLDVQAPPQFSQSPPPISYVQEGDSLRLTCQAKSTPAPILRWYKNKLPINSDAGPYRLLQPLQPLEPAPSANGMTPMEGEEEEDDGHGAGGGSNVNQLDLVIDNIQAGHTTGDYVCLASNTEGSVEARSQVILALPAVITTMPRNQTRLEGERVELACQARAIPANITYRWLFNERPLQALKWFESRHAVRPDGTLVLHSVHRDDQGVYKCQASNGLQANANTRQQQQQQLQSVSSKSPVATTTTPSAAAAAAGHFQAQAEASAHLSVEFPARVSHSPSVQYLPLDMPGIIRCHVQASPPVEFFTWTLNRQQFDPNIDPNVERLQNGSLLIKQVNKHYAGTYRCTPFNKHGSAGSSQAMEVRVEEPPQFEARPADFYKVNLNGQLRIPCEARAGSPRPHLSWRRVLQVTDQQQQQRVRRWAPAGNRLNRLRSIVQQPQQQQQAPLTSGGGGAAAHLAYDEAADEPDETHLYAPSSTTTATPPPPPPLEQAESPGGEGVAVGVGVAGEQHTSGGENGEAEEENEQREQRQQLERERDKEQQPVIVYARLPQERAEVRGAHLYLSKLRKEDHGRYECVIENEVATLVAPTMVYVEETTPHAPVDVRVETKAWSALVSWTPGYDGGFEQSFVVWYRQVDRPKSSGSKSTGRRPSSRPSHRQDQRQELIDVNWRSANVQPGDATSFTIQNLSQDTSYEFYVRAKNIIGDGPRSQIVQATTKRALSGSVTPIGAGEPAADPTAAASLSPDQAGQSVTNSDLSAANQQQQASTSSPNDDDDEHQPPAQLITISKPVAIIRPEFIQRQHGSPQPPPTHTGQSGSPEGPAQQHQHLNALLVGANDNTSQPAVDGQDQQQQQPGGSGNNKVIHFKLIPAQNQSSIGQDKPAGSAQVDNSTAPQKLSMVKVAQGWVLEWAPPEQVPAPSEPSGELIKHQQSDSRLHNGHSNSNNNNNDFQLNKRQPQQMSFSSASNSNPNSAPNDHQSLTYTVELMDRTSASGSASASPTGQRAAGAWQTLATTSRGDRSLLIKDLRPGGEYALRVYAHSSLGHRGAYSDELLYQIPDNRRKPGSTQALSAGVVSGILFFIACIVIAVCGVNMCNKRRKKRAEKAAYVMMACPVLESHSDMAALNSNSLMKNARAELAKENRVPSLVSARGLLGRLLSSHPFAHPASNKSRFGLDGRATQPAADLTNEHDYDHLDREISFSNNESLPVDVEPASVMEDRHQRALDAGNRLSTPLDDYWVRQPSDRRWGTLTKAAGKLAEQRARAQLLPQANQTVGSAGTPAAPLYGARTLPRSFRSATEARQVSSKHLYDANLELRQSYQQHKRSISQIVPPVGRAANVIGAKPLDRQILADLRGWPPTWTDELDWASMSFGPPAQAPAAGQVDRPAPLGGLNNNNNNTKLWPSSEAQAAGQLSPEPNSPERASSLGKRHSTARSTLPLVAPAPNLGPTILVPPYNPAHDRQPQLQVTSDDDPLTDNACLGSYKRKHRRPHIEAQFTISSLSSPRDPDRRRQHVLTHMQQQQQPPPSELFVRDSPAADADVAAAAAGPTSPRPPGLPQPGQRGEQARWRLEQQRLASELRLGKQMGAREKIETYLRHFDLAPGQQPAAQQSSMVAPLPVGRAPPPPPPPPRRLNSSSSSDNYNHGRQLQAIDDYHQNQSHDSDRRTQAANLVELDQVEELTFQPYYNLPGLKYTISLPLRRRPEDGRLLLEGTSHLRPRRTKSVRETKRRQANNNSNNNNSSSSSAGPGTCKPRLGSSSSCPAEPEGTPSRGDFAVPLDDSHAGRTTSTGDGGAPSASSGVAPLSGSAWLLQRRRRAELAQSLESALEHPTVANRPLEAVGPLGDRQRPIGGADSLEAVRPAADRLIPRCADRRLAGDDSSQADLANEEYSSIRATLDEMVAASGGPPPVPPHRISLDEQPQQGPDLSGVGVGRNNNDNQHGELMLSISSSSSSSSSSSGALSASQNGASTGECCTQQSNSVDENYEFDQVSSCSSVTIRRQQQQQLQQLQLQLPPSQPFQGLHSRASDEDEAVNNLLVQQQQHPGVATPANSKPAVGLHCATEAEQEPEPEVAGGADPSGREELRECRRHRLGPSVSERVRYYDDESTRKTVELRLMSRSSSSTTTTSAAITRPVHAARRLRHQNCDRTPSSTTHDSRLYDR